MLSRSGPVLDSYNAGGPVAVAGTGYSVGPADGDEVVIGDLWARHYDLISHRSRPNAEFCLRSDWLSADVLPKTHIGTQG